MALSNNPTPNELVKEVKRLEGAKQDTLPNASAVGKVLKSTDTQGGTEWADIPDGSTKMDKTNPVGTGYFSLNRKANTTVGDNSFAEGLDATASGQYSHAEGWQTVASGSRAHAENDRTNATGQGSHSEGVFSTASGDYSHAEGYIASAKGYSSHAEGYYTEARGLAQHTSGAYNIIDTSPSSQSVRGNYIEIVGNGTENTRSNARTLDWSGNEYLAGNLQAAGLTDGTTTKTMTEILAGGGGTPTDVKVDGTSITSNNEADLQTINGDYNASTNKLATASDLPTVPTNVSAFTNDAGYLTQHQDISGKEDTSNKVTSISSSSTDTQYPSAKAVYDAVQDVVEVAEGKTANYVISYATIGTNTFNSSFNSTQDTVSITTQILGLPRIIDVQNKNIYLSSLKIGDIVSIKETDVPDRWLGYKLVSGGYVSLIFYKLETKLNIDTSPTSGSTNPVSSGGVYTALANKADSSAIPTSIDGMGGGKLTSPLTISGGDSATASKIILDNPTAGQITNQNTATLFGFTSNNATTLAVGHSSYAMGLRGSGTRPTYNSQSLALYNDIPTSYVSSVNGSTGAITNVAKTNADNNFSTTQTGLEFKVVDDDYDANSYGKIYVDGDAGPTLRLYDDGYADFWLYPGAIAYETGGTTYDLLFPKKTGTFALISDLLDKVYPVGSVYMSIQNTSPASFLGGTWTQIGANYALWTATSGAGSSISAGLPNITGNFSPASNIGIGDGANMNGAFYVYGSKNKAWLGSGGSNSWYAVGIDASRSSSIYGNSTTVQPPAYKVYAWRRTA